MTEQMELSFRTADRVRIRYAEAGRGVGETVVLTSPWPESLFAFRKIWGRLAERLHVIAIDLPGFGQSDRRLDLFAPKAMGAFLVKLVNEWQLGPVHFVGPDVGTSAQLWAAATNPDLVRSLVIGGGAMAPPLQTGGALKTILQSPHMDWVTDSAQTLGPVYDAKSLCRVGHPRSEEHTSELQSLRHLVCRLLLLKKKKNTLTA